MTQIKFNEDQTAIVQELLDGEGATVDSVTGYLGRVAFDVETSEEESELREAVQEVASANA